MSATALPRPIDIKLRRLAARVRYGRLLRGIGFATLTAIVGFGTALALDAAFALPPSARYILVAMFVAAVSLATWFALIRPLRQGIDPLWLAGEVERTYPRLGERLLSTVELAVQPSEFSGSPVLIESLARETDVHVRAMDFGRADSRRGNGWLWLGCAIALTAALAPALVWTDEYVGLSRRLIMPWDRRPAVVPFALTIVPGSTASARGRPVQFRAEIVAMRDGVVLPSIATLVLNPDSANPIRRRMDPSGAERTFVFRLDDLVDDVRYRVEAGCVSSAMHSITAVTPVELAGRPRVTVTPPPYATAIEAQSLDTLGDVTLLQHSRLRIELPLSRQAVAARFKRDSGAGAQQSDLELKDNGRTAIFEATIAESGKFSLQLVAESSVVTDLGLWHVEATPDRPPEFIRAGGVSVSNRSAKPSDSLSFDVVVRDDVGIASIDLEYRVNDGAVQSESLPMKKTSEKHALVLLTWPFMGKVKDGDTLCYRLKATDNRNLPAASLSPNVTYHPADDHWSELHIANDADTLARQDVRDQKEAVEKRLGELIQRVASAARLADKVRRESEANTPPQGEQAKGLQQLTEGTTGAIDETDDLAKMAAQVGLDPVAAGLKAVSNDELRRANEELQAATAATDASRPAALRRTEQAISAAREKLEALRDLNREIAKARQDEARLKELADRQRQLAKEAADASSAEDQERIAREQDEIAKELKELTESSDVLKDALKKMRDDDTRRLADKAGDLAKKQRELDDRIKQEQRDQVAKKLAEIAEKQKKLADEADRLSKKATKPSAPPSKAGETAEFAADRLRRGEPEQALQQQAKAADQLDRMSDDIKKSADAEVTRRAKSADELGKLRKLQDEFARRTAVGQKTPADLARAAREQAELQKRFNQIDAAGQDARKELARQALGRAYDDLKTGRASDVGASQDDARRALDRLEDALRGVTPADEKAPELARRQQELADELAKSQNAETRRAAGDREEELIRELQKLKATEAPVRQADAIDSAIKALRMLREKPDDPAANDQVRDAASKLKKLVEQIAKPESERERASRLADEQARTEADAANRPDTESRRRMNQIADEAKQIRGGDRGATAKQALLDALGKLQRTPPNSPQAPQARHDVTDALRKLSDELGKADLQAKAGQPGRPPKDTPPDANVARKAPAPEQPTKADAQKAKDLAKEQRDLIELVRKALGMPTEPIPNEKQADNKSSQEQIAQGTSDLRQELREQTGAQPNTPNGQQSEEAARSAKEAEEAMRDAMKPEADEKQKERSRKKAADALDRAAKQVGRNSGSDGMRQPGDDAVPTGQAIRDAQGRMTESRNDVRDGKTEAAKSAMEKAAEALAKAAKLLGHRDARTPPSAPRDGNLPPPTGELAKDLQKHAGKAWGDLPGELKTRLLQEMKAQYGEDYARVIKLYFEQIAESK